MGFLTRLLAGLVSAATLGAGLSGTANVVGTTTATAGTTGAVTATADDTDGRTVLECRQSGEGATGPYADKFCWIDWSNLPLDRTGEPTPVRISVPGGHIDADATITHTDNAALAAKDFTGSKWSRLTSAYKLTGNTALAFSGRMGRQDPAASVTFSNVTPSADRTDTGVNVLKDFRLAFGDAEVMSGGVLQGHDVYEQTDIESDKTLEKLGMIGSGDPNQSYSKANTGYGTTHVTLAGGPKGATDDANKDSKGAAVVGAKQASRFKVSFGQVNQHWDGWGSAIAVGVYMPYLTAYPLTYDKNASDAAGEVPSNQRGKENTTQPAKTKTNGTVKTVADTNASLPDYLVNGDFEYPGADVLNNKGNWWGVSRKDRMVFAPQPRWVSLPSTFDSDRFAWDSTEVARVQNESSQWHTNEVELQRDSRTGNMYAELCAYQVHTSIRQYIHTTPGTLYKVRLKHASLSRDYLDKMQVLIGPDGNEQPVRMTRVESQNGLDATGKATASTTVSTHASNEMEIKGGSGPYSSRNHDGQWATYEGVYVATSDVTSFTFKSIDSKQYNLGNLLDDIVFDKAYRLSYDKNATDANGSVPSDETAGTVKQAKAKTNGALRLASDDDVATYAASNLPDHIVNGNFEYPVKSDMPVNDGNFWYISQNDGSYFANGTVLGKRYKLPEGFDKAKFAWHSTQTGDTYYPDLERADDVQVDYTADGTNHYSEISAAQSGATIYQDVATVPGVMYKWSFKHASLDSSHLDKMSVIIGEPGKETAQEATRTTANGHGDKLGKVGTVISTKVSNPEMPAGNKFQEGAHTGQWETYTGTYIATGTVTRFAFRSVEGYSAWDGNLLDDISFSKAYKLTYDKNASDATGSVPSDTTANTVKQAKADATGTVKTVTDTKTKTSGTVKTVADTNASLPDHLVNGDFNVNYHDQWKDSFGGWTSIDPNAGKTLRTTTHEDGSVTVKTIDTSTDVVSGCQVYYPAGQKITLATMAKDDDCWDSSMLSRPGHTQLGWNQDRNATAAQPEVTMVEGGMTVYAVWVGNPVLTYDTNKPSTWSGQMPSTPASVSVAYNTAAADGSGWAAGDTSKIRGYKFLGWYTAPQDNTGLYQWATPLTGNVTVYAHWQRLQANVVYNANGGTGSHANTTGWQYSDVTIPGDTSKSFTRDGYVFKGWSLKAGKADVVYKDGSQIPLQDKDITLYAQWQGIHENFTETGGISLPLLIAGGIGLLVMGVGSTVMLTRRMNGHGMPDGE